MGLLGFEGGRGRRWVVGGGMGGGMGEGMGGGMGGGRGAIMDTHI